MAQFVVQRSETPATPFFLPLYPHPDGSGKDGAGIMLTREQLESILTSGVALLTADRPRVTAS